MDSRRYAEELFLKPIEQQVKKARKVKAVATQWLDGSEQFAEQSGEAVSYLTRVEGEKHVEAVTGALDWLHGPGSLEPLKKAVCEALEGEEDEEEEEKEEDEEEDD